MSRIAAAIPPCVFLLTGYPGHLSTREVNMGQVITMKQKSFMTLDQYMAVHPEASSLDYTIERMKHEELAQLRQKMTKESTRA